MHEGHAGDGGGMAKRRDRCTGGQRQREFGTTHCSSPGTAVAGNDGPLSGFRSPRQAAMASLPLPAMDRARNDPAGAALPLPGDRDGAHRTNVYGGKSNVRFNALQHFAVVQGLSRPPEGEVERGAEVVEQGARRGNGPPARA